MVKKSIGSIPRASTNMGSATKVSEEIRIIDQAIPDVLVSGNCFTRANYFDTLYALSKCTLSGAALIVL